MSEWREVEDRDMEPAGLGAPIGVGKEAEVFDAGPHVLKLYRAGRGKTSAFREAATLSIVERLDLPAPSVASVQRYGERWGITMSKAEGLSFGEQMKAAADIGPCLREMAGLHGLVHARRGTHLPSQRAQLRAKILDAALLGAPLRQRLLDGLAQLPSVDDRLCHGDFHPSNILGPPGEAIVVDWLDACQGSPAADVCRTYVLLASSGPEIARRYVDAYSELSGRAVEDIFAWLPFVAAARLAEGVPLENERLLAMAETI
jgi:aminoglycoside phosphotransferase (APT) family kinase protein